jgi:hypothetical protein
MPFRKYDSDPTHVEAMRLAFRKVCDVMQLRCDVNDPATDLIVMRIVEHAKAGELDPDRLCSQVLLELGNPADQGRLTRPRLERDADQRAGGERDYGNYHAVRRRHAGLNIAGPLYAIRGRVTRRAPPKGLDLDDPAQRRRWEEL